MDMYRLSSACQPICCVDVTCSLVLKIRCHWSHCVNGETDTHRAWEIDYTKITQRNVAESELTKIHIVTLWVVRGCLPRWTSAHSWSRVSGVRKKAVYSLVPAFTGGRSSANGPFNRGTYPASFTKGPHLSLYWLSRSFRSMHVTPSAMSLPRGGGLQQISQPLHLPLAVTAVW